MESENSGYIFVSTKNGGVRSQGVIYYAFKTIAKAAGTEPTRLHDCRHTAATKLLSEGEDIATVAEVLRNASAWKTCVNKRRKRAVKFFTATFLATFSDRRRSGMRNAMQKSISIPCTTDNCTALQFAARVHPNAEFPPVKLGVYTKLASPGGPSIARSCILIDTTI